MKKDKIKILNTIKDFSVEAKKILDKIGDVYYLQLSQEELESSIEEYDILVTRIGLDINRKVMDSGTNLKVIATATTGLNHIDVEYAKKKNIAVLSLKDEVEFLDTITSTAELAFGLLIDLMRLTPWAFDSVKKHNLDLEKFKGHSLYGKTIGIVGMGRLGKILARGVAGWRMKAIFFDPNVAQSEAPESSKKVSFDELLSESDAISLHVHLSEDTKCMFNKEVFRKMKREAFLINTSRGEVVDEQDLIKALEDKTIAGYATDVLTNELAFVENDTNNKIINYAKKHDNLIIVPHIGGLTHESRSSTDVFITKKVESFLRDTRK